MAGKMLLRLRSGHSLENNKGQAEGISHTLQSVNQLYYGTVNIYLK